MELRWFEFDVTQWLNERKTHPHGGHTTRIRITVQLIAIYWGRKIDRIQFKHYIKWIGVRPDVHNHYYYYICTMLAYKHTSIRKIPTHHNFWMLKKKKELYVISQYSLSTAPSHTSVVQGAPALYNDYY